MLCQIARKLQVQLANSCALLDLNKSLSLAKSNNSPKGKFTFKKRKEKRKISTCTSLPQREALSLGDSLSLFHLEPQHLSQEVPDGSLPSKGDSEKYLIQQSGPDARKNIPLSKYWWFGVGWGWPVSVSNLFIPLVRQAT